MPNTQATPWDFLDVTRVFYSPDRLQRLEYSTLAEMGQGGPVSGTCRWIAQHDHTIELPGSYSGPPVWDAAGQRVVLPMWQHSILWGSDQRLAMLDIWLGELVVFQQGFRVLHLHRFEDLAVTGVDSPIYNPKSVLFYLNSEAIQQVFKL